MANINTGKTGNVNIPGAIHPTDDLLIGVYTGDVYDDTLLKNLEVINTELYDSTQELYETTLDLDDNKVNYTDVINNLTSLATDKPLSAKQGSDLKDSLDTLRTAGIAQVGMSVEVAGSKLIFTYDTEELSKSVHIAVSGNSILFTNQVI